MHSSVTIVWLVLGCCHGAAAWSLPSLTSPLGPVVNLGYTAYAGNTTSPSGVSNGSVTFFGGIPYAQAPLRDLRFRAPRQLDETVANGGNVGIVDARNWGAPCIQQPAVVGVGSEDCLNLNVWKPTNATEGSNLPVIMYIYGGGFYYGTTMGFPMYDMVAQHAGGIVAVSMSYRLNLFGFLCGSSVAADGDLNVGLRDQRAAVEWVQRHIGKFGGDQSTITIVGESAGGASVVMQTVAFGGSQGAPFKRAIAESIGYGPMAVASEVEAIFQNVTNVVGCPSSGPDAMPCLRNAPVGALTAAINHAPNDQFAPVIDGDFLPDYPSRLIAAGRFSEVDFIGGHCTNDGRTFVGGSPSQFNTTQDVATLVFKRWPGVSDATVQQALDLYPSPDAPDSPFATQYDRAWTMAQDIIFGCMDHLMLSQMANKIGVHTFGFRWNTPDPILLASAPYEGVMHTSDIYFLFSGTNTQPNAGATFTPFNATETLISQEVLAFWTSFAATGDPSTEKKSYSPAWTTYNSLSGPMRMVITESQTNGTTASAMEVIPAYEVERCNFWMQANITVQTSI